MASDVSNVDATLGVRRGNRELGASYRSAKELTLPSVCGPSFRLGLSFVLSGFGWLPADVRRWMRGVGERGRGMSS